MEKYLPIIKDIILCITAITGAWVAIRGLNAWKRQLSGKAEYELAQRLLKATYKLRESIRVVRNPVMSGGEMPDPPEDHPASQSDSYKSWYRVGKAYESRWEHVRKSHIDIEAELLEAEVLWGGQIREKFLKLFEVEHELYYRTITYLDHINPEIQEQWTSEEARVTRKILYGVGGKDDKFYQELQSAIVEIENDLKPYLKRFK